MVKCTIKYDGGLRCELQHGPSLATVSTDAPVDNRGKGESFSPTDLMCSAMAACMETIMGIYAEDNGLNLEGTVLTNEFLGYDNMITIDIGCGDIVIRNRELKKVGEKVKLFIPAEELYYFDADQNRTDTVQTGEVVSVFHVDA